MTLTRYFGLGRETDFASAVAAERFVETIALLNPDQGFILSAPVCDSSLARYNLGAFRTRGAAGPFDVTSDNIGEIINAIMSGEAYSYTDYGNPTVSRRHLWMCGNVLDSYTVRIGAEIEERILAGMLADKLTFKASHAENLKGTVEWVGPGAAEDTGALSSLSRSNLTSIDPFVYHNASGLVTIGTDEKSSNVFDFEVEINNKLPFQRGSMSSRYMATKRHGSRTVTGILSAYFDDDDEYDRFLAGIPFKLDLTFRGALIGQGRYHEIRFLLNNCVYLKDVGHPIANQDEPLVTDCPFQGLYDPTYTELMIELENTVLTPYHPAACPSGEQITNGTIETGDLTGWTNSSGNPGPQATSDYAHNGIYSAVLGAYGSWIQQDLTLDSDCISTFTFWILAPYSFDGEVTVLVTYDDATTDSHDFTVPAGPSWLECDMAPYVTAGKTISSIRFTRISSLAQPYLDDISIIGSG